MSVTNVIFTDLTKPGWRDWVVFDFGSNKEGADIFEFLLKSTPESYKFTYRRYNYCESRRGQHCFMVDVDRATALYFDEQRKKNVGG